MPRNQFQRMVFDFHRTGYSTCLCVLQLVCCKWKCFNVSYRGIKRHRCHQSAGGVYTFGRFLPIWAIVLIEFCFAYLLEIVMGSPCSFKLAAKVFDPAKTHPVLFLNRRSSVQL